MREQVIAEDCACFSVNSFSSDLRPSFHAKKNFFRFFFLIYIAGIFKNIVPTRLFGIPNIYGGIAILVEQRLW